MSKQIPWNTAVEALGLAEATRLHKEGKVADSPQMSKYGKAYIYWMNIAHAAAEQTKVMNENGVVGTLRVQYVEPVDPAKAKERAAKSAAARKAKAKAS